MWLLIDWAVFEDEEHSGLVGPDADDRAYFVGTLVWDPAVMWRNTKVNGTLQAAHADEGNILMITRSGSWRVELGAAAPAYEEVFPGAREKLLAACQDDDRASRRPVDDPPAGGKFPRRTGGSGLRGGGPFRRRR